MNRYRGCILGLLQISVMICITGGLIVGVVSLSVWREAGGLKGIWWQLNRGRASSVSEEQPIARQVVLPTAAPQTQIDGPTPTIISATPTPTPTEFPTPLPRVALITPTSQFSPTLPPTLIASPTPASTPGQPPPTLTPRPTSPPLPLPASILALPERMATRLVIPKMKLDASVVLSSIAGETWEVDHLDQNIGHLQGTASPGSSGNVVLAGHITLAPDGRAGPFLGLSNLTSGDLVTVYHGDQPFTYRIDHLTMVKPTDIGVTYPSNDSKLTLITCLNYNQALGRYEDRLIAIGYLEQGE
jgi:LPXTG-site transpeptidase (sortase) family protein